MIKNKIKLSLATAIMVATSSYASVVTAPNINNLEISGDIELKSNTIYKAYVALLQYTKSDKLKIQSSFEEVYIDEIITECRDELQEMAYEKSIDITMYLIPLTIKGDSKLLKIACINILKNAILYSPPQTEIKITIEENNSKFMVVVQDQGVGISKEDMKYIFDRFYRVEKKISQVDSGTGLGLSIVKMILDIHDFDITIESQIDRGSIVKILLATPLVPPL
jgi:K+-sensing histidine kinase KdpD